MKQTSSEAQKMKQNGIMRVKTLEQQTVCSLASLPSLGNSLFATFRPERFPGNDPRSEEHLPPH